MRRLAILFGVVVVDLIGFGIVMPVLPFYAREYGASAALLGLVMTSYAATQFLCAPLWGRLSDRIGRRPVMLATIAGSALALALLGLAKSLPLIFAARLLGGAFAANVSVASAYIADVTEPSERTRWMGMLGACFGVGFLLGPAFGGLLAPLGYSVPMLAAAGLGALNLGLAAVALPEPARRSASAEQAVPVASRAGVLRDPLVRRLCLAGFAFAAAMAQLETVFAFFMMDRFDYDARAVAFLLVGMAVLMGGIQGGGMKALSARFHERSLVLTGTLLAAFAFLAIPAAPSVAVLLLPLALAAVGRAIVQPSLLGLVSVAAAPRTRGAVMGTFHSSASLARVVGPPAAGFLYDRGASGPFVLACALLLFVALESRALPAGSVGRSLGPEAVPGA